jgi:hypothetical protein
VELLRDPECLGHGRISVSHYWIFQFGGNRKRRVLLDLLLETSEFGNSVCVTIK